jgi:cyclophilin family peptidyl-prolyl cis-trans isomerase
MQWANVSVAAQDSQGVAAEGQQAAAEQEITEETKAFIALQNRLRENRKRINKLYRTLPIGFPKEKERYDAEIARLTAENESLEAEVFDKAKASFLSSDNPSQLTQAIMLKRLNSMIRPATKEDTFNPTGALELVKAMRAKFPSEPQLMLLDFLSNYALERFEEANAVLAEMEAVPGSRIPKTIRENLESTREKYQRELNIRRFEANTDDLPRVRLVTTEGEILVELFENHAPNTVASFIHLVKDQKFYDNKVFHLVKPGQYAQTGSPDGDGIGDAGYRIKCECYEEQIRHHFRGTLSMMASAKDQGGSQFFITHQPNPQLYDGRYTVFGRVIEGMDVVFKLKNIDLSGRQLLSADPSKILRAEIVRARSHPYMPEKLESNYGASGSLFGAGAAGDSGKTGIDDNSEDAGSFDLLLQGGGGN